MRSVVRQVLHTFFLSQYKSITNYNSLNLQLQVGSIDALVLLQICFSHRFFRTYSVQIPLLFDFQILNRYRTSLVWKCTEDLFYKIVIQMVQLWFVFVFYWHNDVYIVNFILCNIRNAYNKAWCILFISEIWWCCQESYCLRWLLKLINSIENAIAKAFLAQKLDVQNR